MKHTHSVKLCTRIDLEWLTKYASGESKKEDQRWIMIVQGLLHPGYRYLLLQSPKEWKMDAALSVSSVYCRCEATDIVPWKGAVLALPMDWSMGQVRPWNRFCTRRGKCAGGIRNWLITEANLKRTCTWGLELGGVAISFVLWVWAQNKWPRERPLVLSYREILPRTAPLREGRDSNLKQQEWTRKKVILVQLVQYMLEWRRQDGQWGIAEAECWMQEI